MIRVQYAAVLAVGVSSPALGDFATDFGVAWDGQGNLAVEFNFASIEVISSFIENGGANGNFTGFFSDEPGFANFEEDEADEGLFVVPDGTVVGFRLLAFDPGFAVYDPFFDQRLDVGDSFLFPEVVRDSAGAVTAGFDDHPWWTVETTSAGFDAGIFEYDMTFELFDGRTDGAAIGSTGPITVTFTRIPAPATGVVLGALAFARRRR
ncbi:MAG: hypothetical protein AAF108_09790 [Planctomycetota bacterium]